MTRSAAHNNVLRRSDSRTIAGFAERERTEREHKKYLGEEVAKRGSAHLEAHLEDEPEPRSPVSRPNHGIQRREDCRMVPGYRQQPIGFGAVWRSGGLISRAKRLLEQFLVSDAAPMQRSRSRR